MPKTEEAARSWRHKPFWGIALMLAGIACYVFSDNFVKYLMGTYSVPQTTFLRALSRLIPLSTLLFFQKDWRYVFQTEQKKRHLLRLLVNLAYTYSFMFSFSLTSLTTVYTVSYTSSFFMILMGTLLLKEKVSKEKWIAVVIGMTGIGIALRPGLDAFQIGTFVVLLGTCLAALNKILLRRLTQTEHTLAITLYPNIAMLLVSFPLLIGRWTPLVWQDILLFSAVGVLTSGGQYAVAQSLRFAKASSLAPVDYSGFFWVILLDVVCRGEIPEIFTLVGVSIIIGSNLYLLYHTGKEERKNPLTEEIAPK